VIFFLNLLAEHSCGAGIYTGHIRLWYRSWETSSIRPLMAEVVQGHGKPWHGTQCSGLWAAQRTRINHTVLHGWWCAV